MVNKNYHRLLKSVHGCDWVL